MNKLVKMALIVASVGMLGLTGCSNGPDATAQKFFDGLAAGKADADFYKKYCTDKTAALFSLAGDEMTKEIQGAKFEITETKIDGDKATCMVKCVSKEGKSEDPEPVTLVKVDGKWKVDINK